MALESTIICIDNSDHMRNGDYPPDRFRAQMDAVVLMVEAKIGSHPQSTVGLVQSSGKGSRILSTPCEDAGKITSALHEVKIGGSADLAASIQVAQLALKHRSNKNGGQRIILFVGSPVTTDSKTLLALASRLKKSNIAVDVINFGEHEENTEKLKSFVDAVNNESSSNLLTVESGPTLLSDVIITSPLMFGGSGGAASGSAAVGSGADPELEEAIRQSLAANGDTTAQTSTISIPGEETMDPDLLAALKMSMQDAPASTSTSKEDSTSSSSATTAGEEVMDPDLLAALKMSMKDSPASDSSKKEESKTEKSTDKNTVDNEEDELSKALKMSMQTKDQKEDADLKKELLSNPSFVNDLFSGLPGVDTSNPKIKGMLSDISTEKNEEKKEEKEETEDDRKKKQKKDDKMDTSE